MLFLVLFVWFACLSVCIFLFKALLCVRVSAICLVCGVCVSPYVVNALFVVLCVLCVRVPLFCVVFGFRVYLRVCLFVSCMCLCHWFVCVVLCACVVWVRLSVPLFCVFVAFARCVFV